MAYYALTDQQVQALLQIVDAASIPGSAVEFVADLKAALRRPMPDADTAERAAVQHADGAGACATGADTPNGGHTAEQAPGDDTAAEACPQRVRVCDTDNAAAAPTRGDAVPQPPRYGAVIEPRNDQPGGVTDGRDHHV